MQLLLSNRADSGHFLVQDPVPFLDREEKCCGKGTDGSGSLLLNRPITLLTKLEESRGQIILAKEQMLRQMLCHKGFWTNSVRGRVLYKSC